MKKMNQTKRFIRFNELDISIIDRENVRWQVTDVDYRVDLPLEDSCVDRRDEIVVNDRQYSKCLRVEHLDLIENQKSIGNFSHLPKTLRCPRPDPIESVSFGCFKSQR